MRSRPFSSLAFGVGRASGFPWQLLRNLQQLISPWIREPVSLSYRFPLPPTLMDGDMYPGCDCTGLKSGRTRPGIHIPRHQVETFGRRCAGSRFFPMYRDKPGQARDPRTGTDGRDVTGNWIPSQAGNDRRKTQFYGNRARSHFAAQRGLASD